VGGNGLVALGTESGERRGVTMSTHCEIRGKFIQIITEREALVS